MFPARPIRDLCLFTSVWLIEPSCPAAVHWSLTARALARGFFLSTSLTNSVFPSLRRSVAGMVASPIGKSSQPHPVIFHGNQCRIHHFQEMRGILFLPSRKFFSRDFRDIAHMHT